MRFKGITLGCIAIVAMLSFAPIAAADDVADLQAQLKSLQARIDNMEQAKMDKVQKEEMAKMMKDILDDAKMQPAMPKWMENLTFYGDFRLRYRMDHHNGRPLGMVVGGNEGKYRNRALFRLRFGITKTWWDKQMEVGFRLSSDSEESTAFPMTANNPNQAFGGGFNKKRIGIDLAYAKYQPKWAEGLTFLAGKMLNPLHTKTYITWDHDVNPEGFALDYVMPFFGDSFKPYAQVGYWIVGENQVDITGASGTLRDTTLWTLSAGFDWNINQDMAAFFGMTYYLWQNYPEAPGNGIPGSNLGGFWGTNPGSNMGMLELTSKFNWKMFNLPWQVWGTWTHNCRDTYSISRVPLTSYSSNFKDQDNAFALGIQVGENKKKGDWSANASYYYVEGDAVPWFTTDNNYGGPNAKGVKMGGTYNIDDFLTIGGTIYIYDPIEGGTWGSSTEAIGGPGFNDDGAITLMIDAIWKF